MACFSRLRPSLLVAFASKSQIANRKSHADTRAAGFFSRNCCDRTSECRAFLAADAGVCRSWRSRKRLSEAAPRLFGGLARPWTGTGLHREASRQQSSHQKVGGAGELPRSARSADTWIVQRVAATHFWCTRIAQVMSATQVSVPPSSRTHLRVLSWLDYRPARDLGCDALPPVRRCDLTTFCVHRTGRYKLIRDVVRDEGQLVLDDALGDRG